MIFTLKTKLSIMIRVLFLCIHNSARSQIAAEYLKKFGGDNFQVESAGLEPGKLNPLAVQVLKEDGIDISGNSTNDVFEFFRQGRLYNYVITVCDEASAQRCPIFPTVLKKIHWSFEDPASFEGTYDEKLEQTRVVRDKIKEAIKDFIKNVPENE